MSKVYVYTIWVKDGPLMDDLMGHPSIIEYDIVDNYEED